MTKPLKAKPVIIDHYWNGVFTGVFLGCFILSVSIWMFIRVQGLKVVINPESLAKMVQEKVRLEAQTEFPQLLEGFKQELPREVDKHLSELNELKIGFGNSEVKLPDEVLGTIKLEFNRIIETAIINSLNDYDTGKYEERIAKDAYDLVEHILRQDIIGKTYLFKPSDWFTVPVKIVGSSKHNLKMKI
jgi:hypothetical protein